MSVSRTTRVLSVDGTRLLLDGRPFLFQGLSVFNALYNPAFNTSDAERSTWLQVFKHNGINALRVWCQWDFLPPRAFVDTAPTATLYTEQGAVRDEPWDRLAALLRAADDLEMVIEVTCFAHEKQPNLPLPALERATAELTERLAPFGNLILQIWNEDSTHILRLVEIAKRIDPWRLVTNSPGISDVLGDEAQNRALDLLTPHTSRRRDGPFWVVAPQQIRALLDTYGKPVIDDEPARSAFVERGGADGGTTAEQHITQIRAVRALGGYHCYHHDMFQRGYGHTAIPPSGLPEPDFSSFHRLVFDYLRDNPQWSVEPRESR